jgi:hypothetical protein
MRHNTFAELPVGYTADPGGSAQRAAILLKAHESMCDGRTSNVHQTGHDLSRSGYRFSTETVARKQRRILVRTHDTMRTRGDTSSRHAGCAESISPAWERGLHRTIAEGVSTFIRCDPAV